MRAAVAVMNQTQETLWATIGTSTPDPVLPPTILLTQTHSRHQRYSVLPGASSVAGEQTIIWDIALNNNIGPEAPEPRISCKPYHMVRYMEECHHKTWELCWPIQGCCPAMESRWLSTARRCFVGLMPGTEISSSQLVLTRLGYMIPEGRDLNWSKL